jgi:hypothetical protein
MRKQDPACPRLQAVRPFHENISEIFIFMRNGGVETGEKYCESMKISYLQWVIAKMFVFMCGELLLWKYFW